MIHFLRKILSAVLLIPLLLTAGCTSFNHEWKKTSTQKPADDLQGRWLGSWKSDRNGHDGLLRCIITKGDDGLYRARFHAKYAKALSFHYTVPLKMSAETNTLNFNGEANLGWLAGGVYHYTGHVEGTNFFSTYSNKYDHGTFQMVRP